MQNLAALEDHDVRFAFTASPYMARVHEELHDALFGFLCRGVPQQVSQHKQLRSPFEQG